MGQGLQDVGEEEEEEEEEELVRFPPAGVSASAADISLGGMGSREGVPDLLS
jgi:hypothetical protein